ncbi:conserved hypothetical protein [Catalinimonas alkaloidigena]|uniref:DUF2383 domain-containing protein n=1 Tax=Catalinimonas alkaloidigena TaxID=1075417 RepID=A0A1G9QP96_9BACT|nr:PA2169 family four-helix-bundle protein [Catalinimonas alkaloidigena]SDM12852.1 conserved hypothetical protein [Catalinimonas alkaloidigena]
MATTLREEVVKTINNLIEVNEEGKEGYELAARNVDHMEYQSLFQRYAQQRAEFAGSLRSQLASMGGEDKHNLVTDAAAALHRGWMNLKSVVAAGDSEAILNECVRGDKAAVEAYESALKEANLPAEISTLLRSQYNAISEAYHDVKSKAKLED